MSADRRIHQRLLICVPCRLTGEEGEVAGRSYDLSEGGAAIMTDVELRPSAIYDLEIRWIQGPPSRLRGQTRYCRQLKDGHYMSGFEFVGAIPDAVRQVLSALRPAS